MPLLSKSARTHAYWLVIFVYLTAQAVFAQQSASKPETTAPSTEKAPAESAKPVPHQAEMQILQQFNMALQDLVAKVSPAVVQIQVTGYGALEGSNPSEAAVIARQQAIGSGVIVDPTVIL